MPGVNSSTRISHARNSPPATDSQNIIRRNANARPRPAVAWRYDRPMTGRSPRRRGPRHGPLLAGLALTVLLLVPGCSAPRDPIVIDEGIITIENQTSRDWRGVKVVVNYHFGG